MNCRILFVVPLLLAAWSCGAATPSPTGGDGAVVELAGPAPAQTTSPARSDEPLPAKELSADAPLEEGHIVFRGMVRPTKGAYEVRGVLLDDGAFRKAIAGGRGADPKDPDWFLGAVVRVEANLAKRSASPDRAGGEIVQTRSGTWFEATRIDAVTLVEPAEIIEGTLDRTKGLYALAGRLIIREELDWSLAPSGGHPGDRVRLHGQPHTEVCAPNTQCLIGGSLPLFDVGRAERLP